MTRRGGNPKLRFHAQRGANWNTQAMEQNNQDDTRKELAELREQVSQLEKRVAEPPTHWEAQGYYTAYHATSGFLLGIVGAVTSLLFNVIGSLIVGQHPLRLIQVYLTFPLGEKALSPDFESGTVVALGCCLYLATGMLLGVPFQVAMARLLPEGTLVKRLMLGTVLGLLLWGINFYGILAWLQPLLFEGNWIVDPKLLPPWVGAATHLVFAWTMAVIYPWGQYQPYRRQSEQVRGQAEVK